MGLIGVSVDITDRKQDEEAKLKEELKLRNDSLEKMVKFASLMAGSMAHELRTPLGAIGMQMDFLKTAFDQKQSPKEIEKLFSQVYAKVKKVIKAGTYTIGDILIKLKSFSSQKLPEIRHKELSITKDIENFLSSFPFQDEKEKS
jgi:signal transduction histidine kinase